MLKNVFRHLCVSLAALAVVACGGGGGGGNSEVVTCDLTNGIEIWTAEDLDAIRNKLDGNYCLMTDISLSAYSSGEGWLPIGSTNTPFKGILDGNGFAVKDLYINRPNTDEVGLFARIENGKISNFGVEIASGGINGNEYVGGITGSVIETTMTNTYSTGDVSGAYSVGGIVGLARNVTITNTFSTGNVNGEYHGTGGIAGDLFSVEASPDTYTNIITNTYSTGNVSSREMTGGIVGTASAAIIRDVYSTGNVTGASNYGGNHVGGIVGGGLMNATISNAYSTGDVVGYHAGCILSLTLNDRDLEISGNVAACEITDGNAVSFSDSSEYEGRVIFSVFDINTFLGKIGKNIALDSMSARLSGNIAIDGDNATIAQLRRKATYTDLGWDFDTVWTIDEGRGMPTFQWEKH